MILNSGVHVSHKITIEVSSHWDTHTHTHTHTHAHTHTCAYTHTHTHTHTNTHTHTLLVVPHSNVLYTNRYSLYISLLFASGVHRLSCVHPHLPLPNSPTAVAGEERAGSFLQTAKGDGIDVSSKCEDFKQRLQ